MNQYDREEQAICEAEERGEITREEAQKQLMELARDYRDAAHERAQQAYEQELERW